MLPQKVMLVDGNIRNTNPADDFCRNIQELLEKDMNSLLENIDQKIAEVDVSEKELKNITLKGINVSGEQTTDKAAGGDYLDEVGIWMTDDSTDVIMSTTPSLGRSSSSGSADSKPKAPVYSEINRSQKIKNRNERSNLLTSNKPVFNQPKEATYATINEIDNSTLSRSVSQETEFNEPCNRNESEKNPFENLSQHSDTPSTSPPSYTSRSSSQESSPTDRVFKLQKNRFWPKAQYAMQQKGVVIFGAAAIVLGTSTALVYLQDKAKFIAFFTNSLTLPRKSRQKVKTFLK